jgi:hypothetical protein
MSRTLAARAREHRRDRAAARFEARARKAGEQVDLIRTRWATARRIRREASPNPRTANSKIRRAFGTRAGSFSSWLWIRNERGIGARGWVGKVGKWTPHLETVAKPLLPKVTR